MQLHCMGRQSNILQYITHEPLPGNEGLKLESLLNIRP